MKNYLTAKRSSLIYILIIVMGLFSLGPILYRVCSLNLANLFFLHWAVAPIDQEQENQLIRAIVWGKRAGTYWANGYGERAIIQLDKIRANNVLNFRDLAENAYKLGMEYEVEGNFQKALIAYQDACSKNEKHVQACFSVYRLLGDVSQSDLGNEYLSRLKGLKPENELVGFVEGSLTLMGYDIQIDSLWRDDEPLPIILYWQLSTLTEKITYWQENDWVFIQVGNRLFQVGEVYNLVPNGGFEKDVSNIAILPNGYQNIIYNINQDASALTSHHRLEIGLREQEMSQVAVVVNPKEKLNGITTKDKVEIEAGDFYVLSGLMKITGSAKGSLGGVWRTEMMEDISYWYIARNSTNKSWVRFNGISSASMNAKYFTLLALNTGEGEVYFDDLLFFNVVFPVIEAGS